MKNQPDQVQRHIPKELKPGRRHPCRLPEESYRAERLAIVMTCMVKRRLSVLTGDTARIVVRALKAAADRREAKLLAYCVMPDHLHFVVRLAPDDTPPKFMRYFKGEASRRINRAWGTRGAFRWQRSYWDTFCSDAEEMAAQTDYVLQNPVRRELCETAGDWPFSEDLR